MTLQYRYLILFFIVYMFFNGSMEKYRVKLKHITLTFNRINVTIILIYFMFISYLKKMIIRVTLMKVHTIVYKHTLVIPDW